ncbi:amidohydrolase family protein [Nonomuraea angiospora]|uniref:amidohydrolase family protein n=1 Tax=Nonomuraea angiospora TaxID=46172 RepID=UPI0029B218A3|nr:amidohydrolase family protein [Nonomuraea angiospora]MDX3099285.1 amidohydrolase family protein [Nonomuraea angiospora]
MIDCHVHLWDLDQGYPWIRPGSPYHRTFTADDLAASGAGLGLTGAILVEASRGDRAENVLLPDLRLRHPGLLLGHVGNLNACAGLGPARFAELLARTRPNGMRLGGASWESTPPGARALVPVLARHGVALEVNLHHAAVPAAAEAAARHPGLTVIVDHLGNPANLAAADPGEWREQVRRAARVSGVFMKISGLLTQQHGVPEERVAALVAHAAGEFGPGRCMIGSDWPICLARGSRAASLRLARRGLAGLDAAGRRLVLSGTARRAYGLMPQVDNDRGPCFDAPVDDR